jgi:hypothetical protein
VLGGLGAVAVCAIELRNQYGLAAFIALFALIFGTVGFGIAFGARKGAANPKQQAAL